MADDKAKDILHQLRRRGVVGDGVIASVGRRAWERPRVAISDRLYKQYRVPDPWDPTARNDTTPVGLGPVSLRLGQKRRQPAPHLKPKEPKKPQQKSRDPFAGLPNVPKAKPKPPAPKPPAPKAPSPSATAEASQKEARAAEVEARMRAAEAARGGAWTRGNTPEPGAPQRVAPALPVRPDAAEAVRARLEAEETPSTQGGRPPISSQKGRGSSGRFRMAASAVTNAPVVRRRVEPTLDASEDVTEEDLPLPTRRPMPTGGAATMDDFFSAAAQMGRLSMPQREAPSASEGEE